MLRSKRTPAILLTLLMLLNLCSLGVSATPNSVVYSETLQEIVITGDADGLFGEFSGMMPGDQINKTVILHNNSADLVHFYLKAEAADTGSFEDAEAKALSDRLLEELDLQVDYRAVQGDGSISSKREQVYLGPASGNVPDSNSLNTYVSLGRLTAHGQAVLEVELYIPTSLGNEYQESLAKLDWSFYATIDDSGGNGGNGNGGNSGGGGNSPGGSSTPDVYTTSSGGSGTSIDDGDTPLGTAEIVDSDTPLTQLPGTGHDGMQINYRWLIMAGAAALIVILVVSTPKKQKAS